MTADHFLRRPLATRVVLLLFAAACGGGGDGAIAPRAAVATVVLSRDTATIDPGGTLQLDATARDQTGNLLAGRSITWSSSDTTKAVVTASGLVTGIASGDVTISAQSEGKRADARFAVTDPGFADLALVSPNEDAALLVTIVGGRVLGLESGANESRVRLPAAVDGQTTILFRGTIISGVIARVRVPDRLRMAGYSVQASQAVARGSYMQRDIRSYSVQLVRP